MREFPVSIEGYGRMTGVGRQIVREDGDIIIEDVWVRGEYPGGVVLDGITGKETKFTRWKVSKPATPSRWVIPLGVVENEKTALVYTNARIPEGKQVKGWSGTEWKVELPNAQTVWQRQEDDFLAMNAEYEFPNSNISPIRNAA